MTTALHTANETSRGPVAKKIVEFYERQFTVASLAFNGDGTKLTVSFMVHDDGLHVWKWQNNKPSAERLEKPGDSGDGLSLSYSPNGDMLAVFVDDPIAHTQIRVWNASTGQVLHDLRELNPKNWGQKRGFVFADDGKILIEAVNRNVHQEGEQLFAYNTDTWELVWMLKTLPFQPDNLALSPNGRVLAMSGEANPVGQISTPSKSKIVFLDIDTREVTRVIDSPIPTNDIPLWITWSPDGLHIAVGCQATESQPDAIEVYETTTGRHVASIQAKTSDVTGLKYTSDGRYLVAGTIDHSARILDGHSYTTLQIIPGDWRSVAISRDGRYLALGELQKISVWELRDANNRFLKAE